MYEEDGIEYSIYLKLWFTSSIYPIFTFRSGKSDGLSVMQLQ